MRISSRTVLIMVPALWQLIVSRPSVFVRAFAIERRCPSRADYSGRMLWMSSTAKDTATTEAAAKPLSSTEENTSATLTHPIILYDGVCNFCNKWVDIMLRIDRKAIFKFAPLQSSVGKDLMVQLGREAEDISSVLLVEKDGATYYDKSDAVLQVVKELGPVAKVASSAATRLVPRSLRNSMYDMVAGNRYRLLGKRTECRCSDPNYAERFLLD